MKYSTIIRTGFSSPGDSMVYIFHINSLNKVVIAKKCGYEWE